jgi:hypothetical protein
MFFRHLIIIFINNNGHDLEYNETNFYQTNVFPNVAVAFRMYLKMPCSVFEGEKSFSKLFLSKTKKRTTMCEYRLDELSLLCTENNCVKKLQISLLIQSFCASKVRKVNLLELH